MRINELQQITQMKEQYRNIEKMRFLKVKELQEIESHLEIFKTEIAEFQKKSRAKLKNSTYKHKNTETTEIN